MARALLTPLTLATPWARPGAGAVLGVVLVAFPLVFSLHLSIDLWVTLLRFAALTGALGTAFVLDDPARETTSTVPTPRLLRQAFCMAPLLAVAAVWWLALLGIAWAGSDPVVRETLPLGAVTLEAGAVFAMGLALASAAVRWRRSVTVTGSIAGPALLVVTTWIAVLPKRFTLVVPVDHPRWAETHEWWAVLLVAALVACCLLALEPTRRRLSLSGVTAGRRGPGAAGSP